MGAAGAAAAAMVLGMSSPSSAARTGTHGATASRPAVQVTPALPGCAWPVETTPTTSNVAAPDPFATYWTTPFLASPGDSITIRGSYPTSRFISLSSITTHTSFSLTQCTERACRQTLLTTRSSLTPDRLTRGAGPGGKARRIHRPAATDRHSRAAAVRERHPDDRPEPARQPLRPTRGGVRDLPDVRSVGRQYNGATSGHHRHTRPAEHHPAPMPPDSPSPGKQSRRIGGDARRQETSHRWPR